MVKLESPLTLPGRNLTSHNNTHPVMHVFKMCFSCVCIQLKLMRCIGKNLTLVNIINKEENMDRILTIVWCRGMTCSFPELHDWLLKLPCHDLTDGV